MQLSIPTRHVFALTHPAARTLRERLPKERRDNATVAILVRRQQSERPVPCGHS